MPEDTQHDALRELYVASYRRLVGQLTAVTGSLAEAEDVVQEAFVRAVASRRTVEGLDNPEAWLRTVAVNLARSRWRRTQRFLHLAPRLVADDTDAGLSPDTTAVLAALRTLSPTQREAVALHHLADLPVREVTDLLGVPVGTVKARLSRGRAALAPLLSDHDPSSDLEDRHA